MVFKKGSMLEKLHKLGALDIDDSEIANNMKRRAKLLLTRRQLQRQVRKPKFRDVRRDDLWHYHLVKAREIEGYFVERYKMTEDSFDKLVDMIDLPVNEVKSMNSTSGVSPIIKPMAVACGLRFLGGEPHKALEDCFHISKSSSKRAVRRFVQAVLDCEALAINLPEPEELPRLAASWSEMSTCPGKPFHGIVLALDGFLCARITPNVANDAHYHNNHKKIHALNVQAAVDHLLRFRYVCVAAPGRVNDGRAYWRCTSLRRWIRGLANEYAIAADNAYPLSNKILIPFKGSQMGNDPSKTAYNFFLSQLRIRVEMAFGRMTQKWQIMRKKMTCSLATQSMYINAITRLHNFVIDNDGLTTAQAGVAPINQHGRLDPEQLEALGLAPFIAVDYNANNIIRATRRNAIVNRISRDGIVRPVALPT